jgi:hypothetical protein
VYHKFLHGIKRHIREARTFSREIGGTDKSVKKYFFSLPDDELKTVLAEYGRKYGEQAERYAQNTFQAWKSGTRNMSATITKRLFEFLPPQMPIAKKYELAESIWLHFAPRSRHNFVIGTDADVTTLANIVADILDVQVTSYCIPDDVKKRFAWLAEGDVAVEEQLLNHFRQKQKQLAIQKVLLEVPVLQRQIREHSTTTRSVQSIIKVHRHAIAISVVAGNSNTIQEMTIGQLQVKKLQVNYPVLAAAMVAVVLIVMFGT